MNSLYILCTYEWSVKVNAAFCPFLDIEKIFLNAWSEEGGLLIIIFQADTINQSKGSVVTPVFVT